MKNPEEMIRLLLESGMAREKEVLICDIQRFSIHDGPGIRTTIFFKGCPLSCVWCHNPETIDFTNQPIYSRADCIGCGDCIDACGESALSMTPEGVATDFARCKKCLACIEVCPGDARRPAAVRYDTEGLLAEAMRDLDYYEEGGGITLSGGEPLAHGGFLAEFLPRATSAGLHVIAETCGYWNPDSLEAVIRNIDLFLYDIKVVDEGRHRELTGRANGRILANLRRLVEENRRVEVRMPLVPGLNDDEENLLQTARLLCSLGLSTITLLPFHFLGEAKLTKMDTEHKVLGLHAPTDKEMKRAAGVFESVGIAVKRS